jgi:uncharacterized protein YodC (DUF2158 family)
MSELHDEDTALKVGDVVSYNSGGHLMTIISIDENSVTCVWSVKGDAKSKSYPAEALKKAAPPFSLEQVVLNAMKLNAMKLQETRRSADDTSTSPSGLADAP